MSCWLGLKLFARRVHGESLASAWLGVHGHPGDGISPTPGSFLRGLGGSLADTSGAIFVEAVLRQEGRARTESFACGFGPLSARTDAEVFAKVTPRQRDRSLPLGFVRGLRHGVGLDIPG